MAHSSPEGIILGKGSKLESLDLSINKEKVLSTSLLTMTCQCMRPSPGDFTANCRNCGFRIKDKFDSSLDSLKQAVETKYPEQTKCYCGHTTTCDCGPEQSPEEEVLQSIKFVLLAGNDAQAIRLLEQYGAYMQELALASKGRS